MSPLDIINKYCTNEKQRHILLVHSQAVANKALEIARRHPEWLVDEPFRMPTSYFQCFIRYRLTMHKQYMTLLLVSTVFIDNVKRTHTLLFYYYHGRRLSRTNHVDTRKLRLIRIKFNT